MGYRVKVLRDADVKLPDRCCGCGMESSNQRVQLSARPMKSGFAESIGAPKVTVPICAFCNLKRRLNFWLTLLLVALLFVISLLIYAPLSQRFGSETSGWIVAVVAGCVILAALIARQVFMPISVEASFDEHWIVCEFNNQLFWEEYYELNRAVARVTEDA